MPDDARLLELEWLSEMERGSPKAVGPHLQDCPERRLAVHLYSMGYATDPAAPPPGAAGRQHPLAVKEHFEETKWAGIRNASAGYVVSLAITHAGAVRRAELEQQLKTGRIKEPMGLVWDGRHFRQDTRIALLDASPERPLAVAYLDLNDVKAFNEKGHATGDLAIKQYLEVIADVVADRGDAYRLSGGADEVVILLPRRPRDEALALTRSLLTELGRQTVADLTLRAAAGVIVATSPTESVHDLKFRADSEQQRAKTAARAATGRPSYLAWDGTQLERTS